MRRNLIGFVTFAIGITFYTVINHLAMDMQTRSLETWIDRAIPMLPWTVLIYIWVYVFMFLPIFLVRTDQLFYRCLIGYIIILCVSCIVFFLWPVAYNRPEFAVQDGYTNWVMYTLYFIDKPANCFPSMHVSNAFFAAFLAYHIHKRTGLLALLAALVISLSTLTTKQHYLADVLSGFLLAGVVYYMMFHKPYFFEIPPGSQFHPIRGLAILGIYATLLIVLFVVYSSGFQVSMIQ